MQYVACGLSFRQVSNAMRKTVRTLEVDKLAGINNTMIGQYVRIMVANGLQVIANVFCHDDVWAVALSFDGSSHLGTTFFDVRAAWRPYS